MMKKMIALLKSEASAIIASDTSRLPPAFAHVPASAVLKLPKAVAGCSVSCELIQGTRCTFVVDGRVFSANQLEYGIGRSSAKYSLHYLAGFFKGMPLFVRTDAKDAKAAAGRHFARNHPLLLPILPGPEEEFLIFPKQALVTFNVLTVERIRGLLRFLASARK